MNGEQGIDVKIYSSVGFVFKVTCEENSCGLFHVKVRKIKCKPTGIHPLTYHPIPSHNQNNIIENGRIRYIPAVTPIFVVI